MFERFLHAHPLTYGQPVTDLPKPTPRGIRATAGGRTFAGGLYRIHTQESATGPCLAALAEARRR